MIVGARLASLLLGGAVLVVGCRGRAGASSTTQSAAAGTGSADQSPKTFRLQPNGGIGFDDLWFSPELHAVLAPAAGTGCVELFDTTTLSQTSLCDVGPGGVYAGGHGEGTTSADFGDGMVFAIDCSSQTLQVIDPKAKRVLTTAPLAAGPDYVRWVSSKRELWVTEPDREQIEIFSFSSEGTPKLTAAGVIVVKGGPESLVVDAAHNRAFTHLWHGRTVQIDISSRSVAKSFTNGCEGSRGIALDPDRGQLFAGCSDGKVVVLDVDHDGKLLDFIETLGGVDIISA